MLFVRIECLLTLVFFFQVIKKNQFTGFSFKFLEISLS